MARPITYFRIAATCHGTASRDGAGFLWTAITPPVRDALVITTPRYWFHHATLCAWLARTSPQPLRMAPALLSDRDGTVLSDQHHQISDLPAISPIAARQEQPGPFTFEGHGEVLIPLRYLPSAMLAFGADNLATDPLQFV